MDVLTFMQGYPFATGLLVVVDAGHAAAGTGLDAGLNFHVAHPLSLGRV
jgi:hypothetical protein